MSLPPLDDLLALLPDNTTGQIEPVDLRFITETLYNGVLGNQVNQESYLLIDGSRDLVSQYIPVRPQSIATKKYVDDNLIPDQYVQRSGDAMSGALFLPPQFPTNPNQAVTKAYADSVTDEFMPLSGGTFTGDVQSNGQPPAFDHSLVDREWVFSKIAQAGGGDVIAAANNFFTGENIFANNTRFDDLVTFTDQVTFTNSVDVTSDFTIDGVQLQATLDLLENQIQYADILSEAFQARIFDKLGNEIIPEWNEDPATYVIDNTIQEIQFNRVPLDTNQNPKKIRVQGHYWISVSDDNATTIGLAYQGKDFGGSSSSKRFIGCSGKLVLSSRPLGNATWTGITAKDIVSNGITPSQNSSAGAVLDDSFRFTGADQTEYLLEYDLTFDKTTTDQDFLASLFFYQLNDDDSNWQIIRHRQFITPFPFTVF